MKFCIISRPTRINGHRAFRILLWVLKMGWSMCLALCWALPPLRVMRASCVAEFMLFAIGAYKARVTVGRPMRSGLEMAVIGTVSALAGYLVGFLLKVPSVP